MKFRVEHREFADSVAWVARSLPSRPPVPVLGGVLLKASGTGLSVSGFDYEVSAQVQLGAEIADEGEVLVSGKLLADITRSLPSKPVDVDLDGTRVIITCGSAKFSLPTMPVEDYPQLPELPGISGEIPAPAFAEAIGQVAVAAGRDDTLPMLTGIRMEVDGESLVLAATDRFRLAVREVTWEPSRTDVQSAVLIPAKTLSEAAKTFSADGSNDIALALGSESKIGNEGLLGLVGTGRRTTTRLLDAEYPKFRQLLPPTHASLATLPINRLVEAIKRVSLVAERGAQVRMEFSDRLLKLSAGDDAGRAEEEMPVQFQGEPIKIAFNPGYLIDGLGAMRSETVLIGMTTPSRPAVLRPADGLEVVADESGAYPAPQTDFTYLLMPTRMPG